MLSPEDFMTHGVSTLTGRNLLIRLFDFPLIHPRATNALKAQYRDVRDFLSKKVTTSESQTRVPNQRYDYTFEIIWIDIIDDVIQFNDYLRQRDQCPIVFICLSNNLSAALETRLRHKCRDCFVFRLLDDLPIWQLNTMTFDFFHGYGSNGFALGHSTDLKWNLNTFLDRIIHFHASVLPLFPLLLYINSISTGIAFNYYYSYLNTQIGSTNNLFTEITFNDVLLKETIPPSLVVTLSTLIENTFLVDSPSSTSSSQCVPMKSNPLKLNLVQNSYEILGNSRTRVTYSVTGVADFGAIVQTVRIWMESPANSTLISVRLRDDVREWNIEYTSCYSNHDDGDCEINELPLMTLCNRMTPDRKCLIFPMAHAPHVAEHCGGVSTMKKTSKDVYDRYMSDPANQSVFRNQRIKEVQSAPVYYLLTKSSCDCGQADTGGQQQTSSDFLLGTIQDPLEPGQIHLAYAYNEVLQSAEMKHYNRYLRRTYYYTDVSDGHGEFIRYLFCAEYPYILSVLKQMCEMEDISQTQKRNEYIRFCNVLQRLIDLDPWGKSMRLIQFDDNQNRSAESNTSEADVKSFWQCIKEDIDEYYERTMVMPTTIDIDSSIIPNLEIKHIGLFCTERAQNDSSVALMIRDLKKKLELRGYSISLTNDHLEAEQNIFICTGGENDEDSRQLIQTAQCNIVKCGGVVRDVFILVNDAIEHFPCRFIRSIPYLTINLRGRDPIWNEIEMGEIVSYLQKMNIISKNCADSREYRFEMDQDSSTQCTSIGIGCAAGFYLNYVKLIVQTKDHQYRLQTIATELTKEFSQRRYGEESSFVSKWVFVLPWTIENSTQLFSSIISLTEEEQQRVGFRLTIWKPLNQNFSHLPLRITVGGIFQRSYTDLVIYQLTKIVDNKSVFFPMEIPAALHGLQNRYQSVQARFKFGPFDPVEQAGIFRQKVFEYQSSDFQVEWHKNIILISVDEFTSDSISLAQTLLPVLWVQLTSSSAHNNTHLN